jgi:hypothetical protein
MSANGRTEVDDEGPTGMSALLKLCAFALADCTILIESQSAKYLRAVHRTALDLAVPNLFGSELGGFWLKSDQVEQLKKLPDCYPTNEIELVRLAVETYLLAQTEELYAYAEILSSTENL